MNAVEEFATSIQAVLGYHPEVAAPLFSLKAEHADVAFIHWGAKPSRNINIPARSSQEFVRRVNQRGPRFSQAFDTFVQRAVTAQQCKFNDISFFQPKGMQFFSFWHRIQQSPD